MEIHAAAESDIPEIVALLRRSLGESLMPKSEAYWRWKHIDNPFGKSPVLLAREGGKLIGVRAFMRWRWKADGRIFTAVRAVDTATDPLHQGKGIFKKLTLKLVDQCRAEGVHFIYNTPNSQSMPGYLKMEWQQAGRLPLSVCVNRPLASAANLLFRREREVNADKFTLDNIDAVPTFAATPLKLVTDASAAYLKWRYADVPVVKYGNVMTDDRKGLLIYRVKSSRIGRELRICDIFAQDETQRKELILRLIKQHKGHEIVTLSGLTGRLPGLLSGTFSRGPIVTVRDLNFPDIAGLRDYKNWSPSIGDLELF